jgi:hypothetical protein
MVSRFLAMRALQPNLSDDSNDDEESQLPPNSSATISQPMHPQYYQFNRYSAQGSFSFQSDDDEESQLPLRVEGQLSHAPPLDDTLSVAIEASADASLLAVPEIINIPHFDERQCICKQITLTTSSASEILFAGLAYAGFDPKVQQRNKLNRNVLRFQAFYGAEPTTISPIFEDLKIEHPDTCFKDALMTFNWLKGYDTYPVLSGRWKRCEEYIGAKVWDNVVKISEVVKRKIVFKLKEPKRLGRTVDCTTFKVFEMRQNPSNKWFDYKHHSCGLKYETCLAIDEPQVCAINGPEIPSMHDITKFRGGEVDEDIEDWNHDALYFQIEEPERYVGDSGYNGEPSKVVVTKDEHSSEFKEFLARAKNRHETFHWRLKSWNILGNCFRHGVSTEDRMRRHGIVVNAIAGIVQYDYENGNPPFTVR